MKRYITTLVILCAVSFTVSAQVSKHVEVTKDYAPEISKAKKMEVIPNMVDTITIRPEIDYTITPRSFASTLGTHRFKPATATYWEYQRRYPFYLKLGAGYPLNTVGDLYAMSHRADVGYIVGYANHYGLYAKLPYENGVDGKFYRRDNRSMQMNNKFGVTGGKYFGRYTLAGDLSYRMNLYYRYPFHNLYNTDGSDYLVYKRRSIDTDDISFNVSFGDSFADYSHLNFKVYASANFFNDKSEHFVVGERYQQLNASAGATLAREITKRSSMSFNVDYNGYYGVRSLKAYQNSIVGAQLMYRYRSGGLMDLNVGSKLYYDHNPADVKRNRWHGFPMLNLSLNIGDRGLAVPYVEVEGKLQNNSYYSLANQNPYLAILGEGNGTLQSDKVIPNTEIYDVRIGVSGHTKDSKFSYRFYASMSFMKNALYWYNVNQIFFDVTTAKRNIWSLCGVIDYRPISQLLISAQVKGSLYSDYAKLGETTIDSAMPNVEGSLKVRYTHKQFTLGLSTEVYGKSRWTSLRNYALFNPNYAEPASIGHFTTPVALDLSLYADWHVNKTWTIFAEGNNLLGDIMPTYRWAYYRELGASFTVGVKVQF